ncbi:hypothetical protein WBP07_17840 [Novosphingobium sp. BL-8A]|uniref:hypothetical protein n=1 Tax=Novosphingobium sp. BL-8A TaxID=3127639 RepID=UPI003757C501
MSPLRLLWRIMTGGDHPQLEDHAKRLSALERRTEAVERRQDAIEAFRRVSTRGRS